MTSAGPERPAVLDATVLSNFAYLDEVDRLQILPRPVTPVAVRDELATGVETHTFLTRATAPLADGIPVVELTGETAEYRRQLGQRLDAGEAAALALAEHRDGLLVTDDGPARSLARDRDVRFTGTIGVLVELVETETVEVDTASEWLTRLVDEASYRAPSKDLSEFL